MDKYEDIINSLPETDRPEFYQIIADNELTNRDKEILIIDRLRQILPEEIVVNE